MILTRLDHYTIAAADLAATRDFYVGVLGLVEGERPPFSFPGHWLYCGDHPVVHLVGGERAQGAGTGGGAVDHVAFAGRDIEAMRERLRGIGMDYQERTVPGIGQRQIFLHDPNGIRIELNFPMD